MKNLVPRLLFLLASLQLYAVAQQLEIHYINVGWGGSVLVKAPNGTTILLEAGNPGMGTGRVVPYLISSNLFPAQGLDYTIAGHQHCDHIGGFPEVVNAGYDVRIRNYYNGSSTTSGCVTDWNDAAAMTTAGALVVPPVGLEIVLGNGAKLTVVAVNGKIIGGGTISVSDENDRSIAVLIQYGGFDYLWASDLGGGSSDEACTGRSTSQHDVETALIQAISPGGSSPMISAGGIDVLHVNHHGSESSTNHTWMNMARPEVAVIGVGAGQSSTFNLPRKAVVENVLLAQATACVTAPPAKVLQTEEGSPIGSETSRAGYAVGNIKISTDGVNTFTVSADGQVSQGPSEVALAALPLSLPFDTSPPAVSTSTVTQQQGTTGTAQIATVSDATDLPINLAVTVRSANPSNGVSITSISVNGAGAVLATVSAACGASNASFTLRVTDTSGQFAEGTLNVSVTSGCLVPTVTSVANATGYQTKVTPGSVFVVFGSNLGPNNIVVASTTNYPSALAGTSVTLTPVGGGAVITARIYYSLNIQVAGLLPSTIPLGTYEVRVTYNGVTSVPVNVAVVARSFGIATADSSGSGPAQATNGAVNGGISLVRYTSGSVSFNGFNWVLGPAHGGDILVLWGTGGGADLANDSGGSSGDQRAAGNFLVNVGGQQVTPEYAGTSFGYPGLWQVNFKLPLNITPNCSTTVQVSAGGELSNQATIAIAAAGQNTCPNPPN